MSPEKTFFTEANYARLRELNIEKIGQHTPTTKFVAALDKRLNSTPKPKDPEFTIPPIILSASELIEIIKGDMLQTFYYWMHLGISEIQSSGSLSENTSEGIRALMQEKNHDHKVEY